MSVYERVLLLLASMLCLMVAGFGVAAVFVPEFRSDGTAIATVLLGGLTTAMTVFAGAAYAKHKADKEDQ